MILRLRGVALFSWLGMAALVVFVGALPAADSGGVDVWPLALVVAGLALGWQIILMRVVVDVDGLKVRNLIRRVMLPWDDISEIRSGVTGAPLTRAMGWRCLEAVNTSGQRTSLTATTGADPHVVSELLARVQSNASHVGVDVDPTDFPTLSKAFRKRT